MVVVSFCANRLFGKMTSVRDATERRSVKVAKSLQILLCDLSSWHGGTTVESEESKN